MERNDVLRAIQGVKTKAEGVFLQQCSREYALGYRDAIRHCARAIPKDKPKKKGLFGWKR